MSAILYINIAEGTVTTTEPSGVTMIEANFPDGTDASIVLPLLTQVVSQIKPLIVGGSTPSVAYKLVFGS